MLKIPNTARISWNTFDDKTVQRDDQESIFLATFDDAVSGEKHKFQIDYSYYNRGRYADNPTFILEVYTCGNGDFETVHHFEKQYKTMDEAEGDINHWLQIFQEKGTNIMLENALPNDLFLVQKRVYKALNFTITDIQKEVESAEYQAFIFKMNDWNIIYREAKITPTKIGQFVTVWKRTTGQPIEPFHVSDEIDFVIVGTRNGSQFGQFIFPKLVLIDKGIISTDNKEGKRAFRVYPPWDVAENKQAKASQKWQLDYFLSILEEETIDLKRAKKLFGL